MGGGEFAVAADVPGRRYLARRRFGTDYFTFGGKWPSDLHAEINHQGRFTWHGVMVEETIVPVASQVLMASQKLPHKIKRRLPGGRNLAYAHTSAHRSEKLGGDRLSYNFIVQ